MMSYEESAAEIRKRRDAIIQNKKNKIKKAITVLSVVLLFTVVGGASIFIGLDRKETPNKPPKLTELPGTNVQSTEDQTSVAEGNESDPEESEPLSESESEPEESGTETETEFESGSEIAPEDETPAQSTEEDPPVAPPCAETGGATYTDCLTSPGEWGDPSVVPPCESGDGDFIDPPYEENKKYTESGSYLNNTFYFEDTGIFYDGVSPLPIKSHKYGFNDDDFYYGPWKERFADYISKLYGDEYDPSKYDRFNIYETDDVYVKGELETWTHGSRVVRRIRYDQVNHMIEFDLDIGAIDGYFDLDHNEAIDYVKNMKYYKAAIEHLEITDPFIVTLEYHVDQYTHSYSFFVYDKEQYLDTSKRTHEDGYFIVFLTFTDYEKYEKDSVKASLWIYQPFDTFVVAESDTVPYATAVNEILTRYDYGDEYEYVKENLKCIPNLESNLHDEFVPAYTFYVEYTDENGSKYYKKLGSVSMFDESLAYPPDVETEDQPGESSVVRPTEGPKISDSDYKELFKVTYHNSFESLRDSFYNYDQSKLDEIAEFEKEYLYDTIMKTNVSDDEIANGIFGNFRKNILEDGSIMIPYIDGKSVCGEYRYFTNVVQYPSYDSSRKPCLTFLTSHPTMQTPNDIIIETTYMDPSIAKEAAGKGGPWAATVMFPGMPTADNYKQYYSSKGYADELEYTTVYEAEYTVGDRKVMALVTKIAIGEDPRLIICFAYDDVLVNIDLNESIAEEVLANFALYECDLNTGKPLRDTPGRIEGYLSEN